VLFPRFSNANPFSFRVTEERTILVNGEIRNEIGAVVAEAKDSQLFVLLGADYDVNSDSSAYEIVDEQLRPVLQFYRRDNPETLQINYVAYPELGRLNRPIFLDRFLGLLYLL